MKVYDQSNQKYILEKEIANHGEGRLFTVQNNQQLLAKIYHQPNWEREHKLFVMMELTPQQPSHPVVAWPEKILYEKSGIGWNKKFVGFLMPLLDRTVTLFSLFDLKNRREYFPQIKQFQLYQIAFNLAHAVDFMHQLGYVIGDVSESNFIVNSRLQVTIVDADSLQIANSLVGTFRSSTGKDEYTPPELTGIPFETIDRMQTHDNFGLAVLIFQLLMNGSYPYRGKLKQDIEIERLGQYCKQKGIFPYVENPLVEPPAHVPPFYHLPKSIQKAFVQCFVDGFQRPECRPSAHKWAEILYVAMQRLVTCPRCPDHVYGPHLNSCPWCTNN